MTDRPCEQMEDLLVEYADGRLPADQQRQVERTWPCESCRRLLAALRQSMGLAEAVWQEDYSPIADLQPADVTPRRRPRLVYAGAAVAAGIGLALLAVFTWRAMTIQTPHARPTPSAVPTPQPLIAASPELTPEQVRRSVEFAGTSAALLASVDWLAEQPANREIARQQYEFIAHMYPDTAIASQARLRLAALDGRSS